MTGTGKAKHSVCYCFFDHHLRLFQDLVRRGETLKLKSNADNKNWELQTSGGKIVTLPGACFLIPPPDAEAMEKVDRYRVQIYRLQYVLLPLFFVWMKRSLWWILMNQCVSVCVQSGQSTEGPEEP